MLHTVLNSLNENEEGININIFDASTGSEVFVHQQAVVTAFSSNAYVRSRTVESGAVHVADPIHCSCTIGTFVKSTSIFDG